MSHGQLILYYKQAVKEGLGLEIQRVVNMVLGGAHIGIMGRKNTLKYVPSPHIFYLAPDWSENSANFSVWN